jgi:Dolichyl-phosphate-mannose-protein mannosyltransferase
MAHTALALTSVALGWALTSLALGWFLGFRAPAAYVVFWTLSACVVATAIRVVGRGFPWRGLADAAVRCAVVSFAVIVITGFLLGAAGLVGPLAYVLVAAAGLAATTMRRAPAIRPSPIATALPVQLALVLCPILAFVVAVGLTQSPLTLYDSLSYHLLFPARWLQEHRLSIVPTPFSDEAQAYAPANGELFFLWLMIPFHGDVFARVGQLPFYLLIGAALYALARRLGAAPTHAAYVPAFALISRPIVEQAVGADVDLVCWAMFLTSLYLGFIAIESSDARDWALWGVAVGLYLGTKYVALVYSPVLAAQPLIGALRARVKNDGRRAISKRSRATLWAIPGILVLGAPWYLRNWIVAGSPIYPSSLTVAGFTIAPGAYSHAAMNHSLFHTADPRLLPVMLAHAFGTPLMLVWLPFAIVGARAMWSAQPRSDARLLLLAPLLMIPLYWFAIPDNVDSRFMLPIALLALIPLAFVVRAARGWTLSMHAALTAGLVWILVGRHAELPVALPYFMGGWLSLEGIVARAFLVPFTAVALAAGGVVYAISTKRSGSPALALPLLTIVLAASSAALTMEPAARCASTSCALLTISPTFIRAPTVDAWRWAAEHIHDSTIAYTGNNVPYPLAGDHLTNRVIYVNIDRHVDWRFHDYERAHRRRRDETLPAAPLATPSGVLTPIAGPARWHVDAVRPRYERMLGDRTAWMANLRARGVDRLFVSALSAYEIDFVAHNDGGFPVEDDWARAEPSTFSLIYDNPEARIYIVHPP